MPSPVLAIHGGAGSTGKDPARLKRIESSLRSISELGWQYLQSHSALDTVTYVTSLLEDDPLFNAGTGARLQADGAARLSASIADGATPAFAGVINLERVQNPIQIARLLLKEPDKILAGDGAAAFARARGFKNYDPITPERLEQWKRERRAQTDRHGTVGAVALDGKGRLAAASSTGGRGFEAPGRVSDSCLPAGNYANPFAAITTSGWGEHIVDEALASTLVVRAMDSNDIERVFRKTFEELRRRRRHAAAIGVDAHGTVAIGKTTELFLYAVRDRAALRMFSDTSSRPRSRLSKGASLSKSGR